MLESLKEKEIQMNGRKGTYGYPSDAYCEKIAAIVSQRKALADADPRKAKGQAERSLEKMGLMKDGVVKEKIVTWDC